MLWLSLICAVFYWRILFTHQFSLLLGFEGVGQARAWFHFWVTSLRQGVWPLWDPYTFAGHAFAGEMQTGAFYPLYLVFLLFPFDRNGLFSPEAYHIFHAASHMLCAFFMYLLAREIGLGFFAGIVAGVAFSLGGMLSHMGAWPHLFESGLWLPVIFLFLTRALSSPGFFRAATYAVWAGLALALSVLAGGLHMVLMNGLAMMSLGIVYTAALQRAQKAANARAIWLRAGVLVAVCTGVALAGGAVQLLISAEYSAHSIRFVNNGAVPSDDRIPYANLQDSVYAHGFLGLLIAGYPTSLGAHEYLNPYMGVFPFLLALLGIWKYWAQYWVRYLTGMAAAAYFYALGEFSVLHGLAYLAVPMLWLAREADRFLFLANFALALLAGFGIKALWSDWPAASWDPAKRIVRWLLAVCAIVFAYHAFIDTKTEFGPWQSLSVFFIVISCALFYYITAGNRGPWARFLVVGFIVFDLYAFDWTAPNVVHEQQNHSDSQQRLLDSHDMVAFLQKQPGLFRVDVSAPDAPNIGDFYGIQTTLGGGVTLVRNYDRIHFATQLFNVRYVVRPASAGQPNPVYQDSQWKVYESPGYPRAWLVHQTLIEPNPEKQVRILLDAKFDARKTALLDAPLAVSLDSAAAEAREDVDVRRYSAGRIDLHARAQGRGLLVLSEVFYPGWKAFVNGRAAAIREVYGGLRGVVVPDGESSVTFLYDPASARIGAILTIAAFSFGAVLAIARVFRRRRPASPPSV